MFKTVLLVALSVVAGNLYARDIGEVNTVFKWIGPDHKIVVNGFEDPKISGVTCFLSRAKTGGVSGSLGFAEDPSDASVACRQTGPIVFTQAIVDREEVFTEKASILFKKVRVVRFYDAASNSLIYLVYSDKMIDGSPKNSISAVWLENVKPRR